MSALLQFCQALMSQPSVSPDDAGCQKIVADHLQTLGFNCNSLPFGDVNNLWATRGTSSPILCFAGHTDVVPPGPLDQWNTMPFTPHIDNGKLYGRGAADMKGALAAMVMACTEFITSNPKHSGCIAFLITSDEEGEAKNGTKAVMKYLTERDILIDHCVVGEPSSNKRVGDQVRVGRRGSLHLELNIIGQQGHVAYPESALNPIHQVAPAITELCNTRWDDGNQHFPPTTFQISNLNAGTGANNVIPGQLQLIANFRFSTASTAATLQQKTEAILNRYDLEFETQWNLSGEAFLSSHGALTEATISTIYELQGYHPELSTGGGTSDGRFIAPYGTEVIELGPVNATIHQANEHVDIHDLEQLQALYFELCKKILL